MKLVLSRMKLKCALNWWTPFNLLQLHVVLDSSNLPDMLSHVTPPEPELRSDTWDQDYHYPLHKTHPQSFWLSKKRICTLKTSPQTVRYLRGFFWTFERKAEKIKLEIILAFIILSFSSWFQSTLYVNVSSAEVLLQLIVSELFSITGCGLLFVKKSLSEGADEV